MLYTQLSLWECDGKGNQVAKLMLWIKKEMHKEGGRKADENDEWEISLAIKSSNMIYVKCECVVQNKKHEMIYNIPWHSYYYVTSTISLTLFLSH